MERFTSTDSLREFQEATGKGGDSNGLSVNVCCGTGCVASGAHEVFEKFKQEIKAKKIDAKVGSKATGCHGFCERGPLVIISPERIFYQRVTVDDVAEIVEETLVKKKVVERLSYTDPATGEKIKLESDVPFYKKQQRVIFGTNGAIDPTDIEDYIRLGG